MLDKHNFLKQFDAIPAQFPVQGAARDIIHNGLDFPTTKDEYWKYTRVAKLLADDYSLGQADVQDIEDYKIPGLEAHYMVFVNGVYANHLSDELEAKGVKVGPMSSMDGDFKTIMLEHLGAHADKKKHAFTALNTSYFKDGSFVHVQDNVELDKPICILHFLTGQHAAVNQRHLVVLGKHSKAQFIQHFVGESQNSFSNVVTEAVAGEGSSGELYLIQDEGDSSSQVNTTQVVQGANSNFTVLTVTISGELVRNNLNFSITDQGCESNLFGLYFTSGKQHVDNHTYADHQMPNCNSNELYKGVMNDRSTGVFNGKIMVHQDAQQTNAFQSNQNILLTDRATVNTKPELEIYADDVKCSHGCTIGQLDEEAMFYLQSRGLGKEAATKLLLQAFAEDVLEKVAIDSLRSYLSDFIESKFT